MDKEEMDKAVTRRRWTRLGGGSGGHGIGGGGGGKEVEVEEEEEDVSCMLI